MALLMHYLCNSLSDLARLVSPTVTDVYTNVVASHFFFLSHVSVLVPLSPSLLVIMFFKGSVCISLEVCLKILYGQG